MEDAKYLVFVPKTIADCSFLTLLWGVVMASAAPKLKSLGLVNKARRGRELFIPSE